MSNNFIIYDVEGSCHEGFPLFFNRKMFLCIKEAQPKGRLRSRENRYLAWFNDAVFAVFSAIHNICCIRFSVCENEEVVAKHIHL